MFGGAFSCSFLPIPLQNKINSEGFLSTFLLQLDRLAFAGNYGENPLHCDFTLQLSDNSFF